MQADGARGLSVRHVHAFSGGDKVLADVSCEVAPGEILVLFGPTGGGKTALLRAIAGAEPAARGQILIAGREVSVAGPARRDVGIVFQDPALYPHLTTRGNIASPLRARHLAPTEIAERIARLTGALRIGHLLEHAPDRLSRGQRHCVALARALAADPKVLLLDDPLRHVDVAQRYQIRLELPGLLRSTQAATILVTQDYREAMALADRIAVLIDGRIVQDGTPTAIYETPASLAVARLFGDIPLNLLPCRPAGSGTVEALRLRFAWEGGDCLLGLRPQDLALTTIQHPRGTPVELVSVSPRLGRQVILVRTADGDELLASTGGAVPRAGAALWAVPDHARAMLFDTATGLRVSPHVELRVEATV